VNRLMRPMNKNLQVLGTLNNPQIKIYIEQENPTTLRILKNRMTDLGKCSDRLLTIGPPPADANNIKQLRQVDATERASLRKTHFRSASAAAPARSRPATMRT